MSASGPGPLRPLGDPNKPSKVEQAKVKSRHLRGTIKEVLADATKKEFEHDDLQLLKFHGSYQQDDRDNRAANKALGAEAETSFMVRIKVPGGVLTPEQYLAMDQVADEFSSNHSLRVTTRQNFQLHGILKTTLQATIKGVNEILLSTLSGCGDVARNVMAPPAPLANPAHQAARGLAQQLSEALCPQTRAYYEIWLNGELAHSSTADNENEPLYGEVYLPRKFKSAIGLPEDNSVDVHSQDVGLVAILEGDRFLGVNILVGGGLGMTHKKEDTYARLATELGYVEAAHAVDAVRTIAAMFRDYGDRSDRKHARLKYVVEEQGIEAFRAEFQRRVSFKLQPWKPIAKLVHQDWLGRHEQGDGKFCYGIFIPNGRIADFEKTRIRTALRKIIQNLRPLVVLTPNQNILLGNLTDAQVKSIEKTLAAYNVALPDTLTWVERGSMACVALPTCGLALTEAERVLPEVVDQLEDEFRRLNLENVPLTIRMTGCPNGCARPYTADIGLVGHKPGHYDLFLGGSLHGHRVAEHYSENVKQEEIGLTLRPVLEAWSRQRMPDEPLGDFYDRVLSGERRRDLVSGDREHPARPRVEKTLSLPVLT
jgi:sulfite reductase beta subunit-like hemoprotein